MKKSLTFNFVIHYRCLTPENFTKFGLDKIWTNLATGNDLVSKLSKLFMVAIYEFS
jgi:hypothetical protein